MLTGSDYCGSLTPLLLTLVSFLATRISITIMSEPYIPRTLGETNTLVMVRPFTLLICLGEKVNTGTRGK